MALLASDTFTRADSAISIGTADLGGAYTATVGTWGIASNTARLVSGAAGLVTLPLAADGIIRVTLATMQDTAGLSFRAVDASNHWKFTAVTGFSAYGLHKTVAGAETSLGVGGSAPANGDSLMVGLSGSSILCFVNEVLVLSVADSALQTATLAGLGARGAATTARWDTFSFETVPDRNSSRGNLRGTLRGTI